MNAGLYWREPLWLLVVLYPLVLWLWGLWRRRWMRTAYADAHLWAWVKVSQPRLAAGRVQPLLLTVVWILLAVTAAGPRTPLEVPEHARPPQGALVAVLDLSRSMDARDSSGSRRAAAVRILRHWADTRRPVPLGLVVYAGRAHVYLPPTTDSAVLAQFLEQARTLRLPTLGNDLAGALQLAAEMLQPISGERAIVILSDGDIEAAARGRAETAVEKSAFSEGIDFAVVGVGTTLATALPDAEKGWLMADGRPVVSRLEEGWLQRLTTIAGGRYVRLAGDTPVALDAVWHAPRPRIAPQAEEDVLWQELYPWILAPAVLLLVVAVSHRARPAAALVLVSGVLGGGMPTPATAAPGIAAAYVALTSKDYASARAYYEAAPGFAGRFGEGVACWYLEDLACATQAFASAAWLADNDQDRARSAYNLATVLFRQGDYEQSAVLYGDALAHGLAHPRLPDAIALAENLARQVEQHLLGQQRLRKRMDMRPGEVPVDSQAQVAVGRRLDDAVRKPAPLPQGVDRARFDELLTRGFERARLVAGENGAASNQTLAWFGGEDIAAETPAVAIWERLFEIEEGFPAPVRVPRSRPEERPW